MEKVIMENVFTWSSFIYHNIRHALLKLKLEFQIGKTEQLVKNIGLKFQRKKGRKKKKHSRKHLFLLQRAADLTAGFQHKAFLMILSSHVKLLEGCFTLVFKWGK